MTRDNLGHLGHMSKVGGIDSTHPLQRFRRSTIKWGTSRVLAPETPPWTLSKVSKVGGDR